MAIEVEQVPQLVRNIPAEPAVPPSPSGVGRLDANLASVKAPWEGNRLDAGQNPIMGIDTRGKGELWLGLSRLERLSQPPWGLRHLYALSNPYRAIAGVF